MVRLPPMSISARRLLVFATLVAWVLLGPIGMSFDTCAAMMALCDGPCGVVSAITFVVPILPVPTLVTNLAPDVADHLPLVRAHALEPPPKLLALSA
jgi:hypothetical protein